MENNERLIPLFYPFIADSAYESVKNVLNSKWIGQGPLVDDFENLFAKLFLNSHFPLAVGSGTDALHLAYLLAGIKPGDEVLTPVFTCTATNIPLLYIGAKPVFVDIDKDTMNISVKDLERKISKNTKAIVVVHFGGLPCEMTEINEIASGFGIPVIEDAAHALGATYKNNMIGSISDFTIFSFQAIKHITTGDGGLLSIKNSDSYSVGKRLRWFGIDRASKLKSIWESDISEVGYKYQMTDLSASLGLSALNSFDYIQNHRNQLFNLYTNNLSNLDKIKIVGMPPSDRTHAAWIFTICVKNRLAIQEYLKKNGVETSQVHYRNDKYSIFSAFKSDVPNMDLIENDYLVLPMHHKVTADDVNYICDLLISAVNKNE